jgi:DNA-3-methyladenine glycosylase II
VEVAAGRADPGDPASDARLLGISEIGPWTLQCLGIFGRGEPDALPAGDLAYVKLVGRMARLGRRATENEVREFFAPYGEWKGLAATYVMRAAVSGLSRRDRIRPGPAPGRAGTRSSAPAPRSPVA